MKLVDRYLLREHLVAVTYCLVAFCMAQVICDLLHHLSKFLEARAGLKLIFTYYLFHLGPTLEYLMPAALLLATLYTLWQLTRHNELTAMRASGVSLYRVMIPFLVIGVFFSIAGIVIKETFAPRANRWATTLREGDFVKGKTGEKLRDVHYMNNDARHEWRVGEVDTSKPHVLSDVTVKKLREDGSTYCLITAKRAERFDGSWWFFDGTVEHCNIHEFPTNITEFSSLGTEMKGLTAKPSGFVVTQWPEEVLPAFLSSREMKKYIRSLPVAETAKIARFRTDMYSRLAIPWACLVAVMLGIPAGARTGRESALTGFFLALGLFFVFHALNQSGLFLAKKQLIWPWLGAWFSNIVFLTVGLVMIRRMK